MHPVTPVRTYVLIWLTLTIMTFVTFYVSTIDLGAFNIVIALAIAFFKMMLVIWFFMHVRTDNPLTKPKVRQAIISAIDRATMAKQLIQGDSQVINTPCFPTQFGCDVSAAVKYPYDPARAKQLLTEAGYPNGFDTELVSYATPQVGAAVHDQ